jgi:hypothetical protein
MQQQLPGKRVVLRTLTLTGSPLLPGHEGTVARVDDAGTVHVTWDNGEQVGLVYELGDRWNVLP